MNPWLSLVLAIVSEVIATTALKASEGFSRPLPSLLVVLGYGAAFYLMSLSLKDLQIGTVYAIWAGLGVVGTVAVGALLFREPLDAARIAGVTLILVGVVVLNVFSKVAAH